MNLSVAHSFTKAFWSDENGFIVSAELVLIGTICVLGLITGLSSLQSAIVFEMHDMSRALCSLDHSFTVPGFRGCKGAFISGSGFIDNFNCQACQFLTSTFNGVNFSGGGIGVTGGGFGMGGAAVLGGASVGVGGGESGGGSSSRSTTKAPRAATPCPPGAPCASPCPSPCPTGDCPPAATPICPPDSVPGATLPPQYAPPASSGPVFPGAPNLIAPAS